MNGDLFAAAPEGAAMAPPDYPTEEHAARIHHVRRPRYVEYDSGAAVLARLDWLFDQPKVARPPCSLIYADTYPRNKSSR